MGEESAAGVLAGAPAPPLDHAGPIAAAGGDATRSSQVRTFLVFAAAYLAVVAVIGAWMAARNGGHFAYPLDDPYIHLSMARNLAEHGTWGIDPGVYESASSSPAWTVLVATGLVVLPVGDVWVPLALAVASGLALIWQLVRIDPFRQLPPPGRWAGLVVACIPLGLVHVTFIGMEHLLHAALVLAIVVRTGALLDVPARAGPRSRRVVLGLLAVATLVRYETVFLAAGLAVALVVAAPPGSAVAARLRRAVPVVAASLAPLVAVAAVNVAFGQLLLPNSIVVKTRLADGGAFGVVTSLAGVDTWRSAAVELARAPEATVLLAGVVVLLAVTLRRRWAPWQVAAVAVCVTAALTVLFANLGWFGRYNICLVAACYGVLGPVAADPQAELGTLRRRPLAAWLLVLVVVAAPVQVFRASWLPAAGSEIYRQHAQIARFVADDYPDDTVAVSDLGYVAWLHQGDELDLWGLASVDVARALRSGRYDVEFMDDLAAARDARAIVIYQSWFEDMRDGVPPSWVAVERWCLDDGPQRVVGGRCVTWFTRTAEDADVLRQRLDADRSLPDGVTYEVLDSSG